MSQEGILGALNPSSHRVMRFYSLLLMLFAGVLFVSGCSKKKDDPSKKDLLASGSWKLTAWKSDPPEPNGTTTISDRFAQITEPCNRDNLLIFTSDGKFSYDEGPTKCQSSFDQVYRSGTWTLGSDDKTLDLVYTKGSPNTKGSLEFTISDISGSQMILTYTETDGTTVYTQTQTFMHP